MIGKVFGRGEPRAERPSVRGVYDAAQTTTENENHWAAADSLSANAANDPGTRQLLRDRARYEVANNGYAAGLVESLANDLVGTGPRLQLNIPGVGREVSRAVEVAFANWSRAADYPEDLRVLHRTKVRDGECFAMLIDNPRLPELSQGQTTITLDLRLYEAEQVSNPLTSMIWDPSLVDGIQHDEFHNPIEYHFLKAHPGGMWPWLTYETSTVNAPSVAHWYHATRPGQARGISTLVPGLPLYAQLRRYTLATLGAAELAAMLAGVMKSTGPVSDEDAPSVDAMDHVQLARGALLTLPAGWDAMQFKPEQPTQSYKDFKGEILKEIGRGAQTPAAIMHGSSENYNYSSARLDQLIYHRMIRVERSRLRHRVLDKVFLAWVQEAALARAIPERLPPVSTWAWEWHFDGFDSIDPQKDAQTDDLELRNHTTTLQAIFARKGLDWEEALRQRAREQQLLAELRLTPSAAQPAVTETSDA